MNEDLRVFEAEKAAAFALGKLMAGPGWHSPEIIRHLVEGMMHNEETGGYDRAQAEGALFSLDMLQEELDAEIRQLRNIATAPTL